MSYSEASALSDSSANQNSMSGIERIQQWTKDTSLILQIPTGGDTFGHDSLDCSFHLKVETPLSPVENNTESIDSITSILGSCPDYYSTAGNNRSLLSNSLQGSGDDPISKTGTVCVHKVLSSHQINLNHTSHSKGQGRHVIGVVIGTGRHTTGNDDSKVEISTNKETGSEPKCDGRSVGTIRPCNDHCNKTEVGIALTDCILITSKGKIAHIDTHQRENALKVAAEGSEGMSNALASEMANRINNTIHTPQSKNKEIGECSLTTLEHMSNLMSSRQACQDALS